MGYNKYFLSHGMEIDIYDVATFHKYNLKLFIGKFIIFYNMEFLRNKDSKFAEKYQLQAIFKNGYGAPGSIDPNTGKWQGVIGMVWCKGCHIT